MGYADDAALTELGEEEGIQRLSSRVTSIVSGSRTDTDIEINVDKTKTLNVRSQQDTASETINGEANNNVCAFTCPHLHCGHEFLNVKGMIIHEIRCKWENEFKVHKIMGIRGVITTRQ